MSTTATHCTKCQLPMNLHSSPPRSPSPRRLPGPLRSLSLSLNPSPRPRQHLSLNLSLNLNHSRSLHNLNNPRAQLQHPSSLPHPRPGALRRRSRPQSRRREGRRPLEMGHWALQHHQVRHLCTLHRSLRPSMCAQIDLYHARLLNHPIRLLRPPMAWLLLLVLCLRPLCMQCQSAILRLAILHARPRSLFLSLRKCTLRLNFKTRFNNVNSKKAS